MNRSSRFTLPRLTATFALPLALALAPRAHAGDVLTRITDIGPGTQDGINELDGAVLGGFLYFVTQPGDGTSLYRTNGVAAPTPVPNTDAADPREVIAWNGKIYFSGGDDREVWEYDPGDDSVTEVVEIRTTGNTVPQRFAATPDRLCFGGFTDSQGFEYHCWDGVTAATTYDLEPGITDSFPDSLVADGDRIAFVGRSGGEAVVYFQDGNTLPVVLPVAAGHAYDSPCCLGFSNGILYFDASDVTNGDDRLYRYDGVTPAARVSETFNFDGFPASLRDRLLVTGTDASIGVNSPELFRLSGTTLSRAAPGWVVQSAIDPIVHDGALFLNGWNGTEVVYRFCGAGPVPVLPMTAAGGEVALPVEGRGISFAGRYYFAADSAAAGTELWALASAHRHCDGFEIGGTSAWSAVVP
jgi:hypothetical protein